jgi:hypothetical protein
MILSVIFSSHLSFLDPFYYISLFDIFQGGISVFAYFCMKTAFVFENDKKILYAIDISFVPCYHDNNAQYDERTLSWIPAYVTIAVLSMTDLTAAVAPIAAR